MLSNHKNDHDGNDGRSTAVTNASSSFTGSLPPATDSHSLLTVFPHSGSSPPLPAPLSIRSNIVDYATFGLQLARVISTSSYHIATGINKEAEVFVDRSKKGRFLIGNLRID